MAFATVYVTTPVASTTYTGGQNDAKVDWQDDNKAPSLKAFGPSKVGIFVGNAEQQTLLQTLQTNLDVSTESEFTFTPDATIGPDSNEYFIRFESLALQVNGTNFPQEAFSAKFTLTGMTGSFASSVQAEIAGQSTAPLAGSTSTSGSSSATSAASLTVSSSSGSASHTTSATAKPSSGAMNVKAGWAGIVFGAVVGVTMF